MGVGNVVGSLGVAYIDQAQVSQNELCYYLGYLERALVKKHCRLCVQNLGMLLGHLMAEKARAVVLLQWLCLFQ
jgi:hypothetical protein